MIRHVVMWTFAEQAGGRSRSENLAIAKAMLEDLPAKIPEVVRLEVGIDEVDGPTSAHLVLVSDFESWDALAAYQDHPAHQEVVAFVGEARMSRWAVDYEYPG